MTSFVVVSTDQSIREKYIQNFCVNHEINPFDIYHVSNFHLRGGTDTPPKEKISSIGIEEIKNIHKNIYLKPLNSKIKAIIIDNADLLTIPAQNALLKVLEEPPDHTIIMLGVDNKESLLPTILSRCQIIELQTEQLGLSNEEKKEFSDFIDRLPDMTIGERLKKAEELSKDKDQSIEWIAKLILALREKMLESNSEPQPAGSEARTIRSFQELHTLLKTTNVNPRLAIENTFLFLI